MAVTETTGQLTLNPIIVSRITKDSDGNARIDRIEITASDNLNDDFSGFSAAVTGYTVAGYDTGSAANDEVIEILLKEKTEADTGVVPGVQITNSSLRYQTINQPIGTDPAPVATTDGAAPIAIVALSAVDGDNVYVKFSEGVHRGYPGTTLTVGDFTYNGTNSFDSLAAISQGASGGMVEIFLHLSASIQADDVFADSFSSAGTIYDSAGNAMGTGSRRLTDIGIGLVIPVWASDGVHTDEGFGTSGNLRVFDGTGRLMDRDITIETNIAAANAQSFPSKLYYDISVPESVKTGELWLPEQQFGIVANANTDARSLDPDRTNGALRTFLIPEDDSELEVNTTVEFVLKIGGLYNARLTDPDDPRTVAPWSFSVQEVVYQRGGVTILNNVINPTQGEKTNILYMLDRDGMVRVQVFTLGGDLIDVLFAGRQTAGSHTISWGGTNRSGTIVARGIYFIRVIGPDFDEMRKVIIEK